MNVIYINDNVNDLIIGYCLICSKTYLNRSISYKKKISYQIANTCYYLWSNTRPVYPNLFPSRIYIFTEWKVCIGYRTVPSTIFSHIVPTYLQNIYVPTWNLQNTYVPT